MGMKGGDTVLYGIQAKGKCRLQHVLCNCKHMPSEEHCGSGLCAPRVEQASSSSRAPSGPGAQLPAGLPGPGPGATRGGAVPGLTLEGRDRPEEIYQVTGFRFQCFSAGWSCGQLPTASITQGDFPSSPPCCQNPHGLYFLRRKCVIWLPSSLRTHANN